MKPGDDKGSSSLVESIAGLTAGVVTTLVVHPLDVVKTRLQVNASGQSQIGTSYRITRDIIRNEGNFRALYRGLSPNIVGNSLSWGIYFFCYGKFKRWIKQSRDPNRPLSSVDFFVASGASGILAALCTNPIWVIKTRMLSTGRNATGSYRSSLDGVSQILKNEGARGFYRGLIPSLIAVSHGALQFVAYEELKRYRAAQKDGFGSLSNVDFLTLSALSKILAGTITYPLQLVRTRLQTYGAQQAYSTVWGTVRKIGKIEGMAGFYKGITPNLFRVVPSTCVTFLVYENTKYYLSSYESK